MGLSSDTDALRLAGGQIRDLSDDLSTGVAESQSILADVAGATGSGELEAHVSKLHAQIGQSHTAMVASLAAFAQQLMVAAVVYEQADAKLAAAAHITEAE